MLGFMLTTMFLSMWISNTATTAMMVPIIEAIIEEISHKSNPNDIEMDNKSKETKLFLRNTMTELFLNSENSATFHLCFVLNQTKILL